MRHLYKQEKDAGIAKAIEHAKAFERRRCGHKPDEFPEPLPETECLMHCIDGKGNGTNKHRYVVASQDTELRRRLRQMPAVPLIYIVSAMVATNSNPVNLQHKTDLLNRQEV
jgi:U3 small nucleolar RNA-associated protein 23